MERILDKWQQCAAAARNYKTMFRWTFCTGLAAYGFIMCNVLNNQDNIANTPGGYGAGTASGRWLLEGLAETLRVVWGTNTLPLFNGLLSIALVTMAACLTVSVLDIRSRRFSVLAGMLFVTFPSFAMTMLFMFTVGYYAFSLLLSVLAVYAAKRCPGAAGAALGTVCVTLSLGIYQAYLPVTAALFLLILLRRGLTEQSVTPAQLLLQALRSLAVLGFGTLLYMGIVRLLLRVGGQHLNTYQQIDQMGSVKLSELPEMCAETYRNFFALPFRPQYALNDTPVIRFTFLCVLALSLCVFVWLEARGRFDVRVKALNALWFALFPLGAFGIVIMCYHSSIFGRMAYGVVTVFFLPLVLLECAGQGTYDTARKGIAALLSVLLLLTSVNYLWQSNENYMVLYYTNRQTENYFASMVTRIRMTPGYGQDLLLAFIGDDIDDKTFSNDVYWKSMHRYGGYTDDSNYQKAGRSYMANYMGFHQPLASDAQVQELAGTQEVQNMPCYPDDGSIRVIGTYIVVKLENV